MNKPEIVVYSNKQTKTTKNHEYNSEQSGTNHGLKDGPGESVMEEERPWTMPSSARSMNASFKEGP